MEFKSGFLKKKTLLIYRIVFSKDREKLSEFVTERANDEMMDGVYNMTLKWKFIESIEPPKIVHARTMAAISESNLFSQLTIRFHTKQVSTKKKLLYRF